MGDSGLEPDLRRGGFRRAHSHVGKDGYAMAGKTPYTVIVADDEDELREAVCMMTPWPQPLKMRKELMPLTRFTTTCLTVL